MKLFPILAHLTIILCFTISCKNSNISLTPAATDSNAGKDIFALNQQLGSGVNFGNALEAPKEGEWGMVIQERFFDLVKEGGFKSIRLPVKWSNYALAAEPFTIQPTFFERIDWCIAQATKRGLNIVVNVHHYENLDNKPAENVARWVGIWEQVAARYKDQSDKVYFEIYNEPHNELNNYWNGYLLKGIEAIRKTNATRPIILGGINWNGLWNLKDLRLPNDKNLIVTFHYYEPFQFTHQEAEWVDGANAWKGTKWQGAKADTDKVIEQMNIVDTWAKQNNRPIYMGEFGSYSKADQDSRVKWTTFVRNEAEKRGFSWSYWEFGAGFGIYDRDKNLWRNDLLKALIP